MNRFNSRPNVLAAADPWDGRQWAPRRFRRWLHDGGDRGFQERRLKPVADSTRSGTPVLLARIEGLSAEVTSINENRRDYLRDTDKLLLALAMASAMYFLHDASLRLQGARATCDCKGKLFS